MFILRCKASNGDVRTFTFTTLDELKNAENIVRAYFNFAWFAAKANSANSKTGKILSYEKGGSYAMFTASAPIGAYRDHVTYEIMHELPVRSAEALINASATCWASDRAEAIHVAGDMWILKIVSPFTD